MFLHIIKYLEYDCPITVSSFVMVCYSSRCSIQPTADLWSAVGKSSVFYAFTILHAFKL